MRTTRKRQAAEEALAAAKELEVGPLCELQLV